MKISRATIDLVKKWEGLRLEAYLDSVGVPTIGYGTTSHAGYGEIKLGMKITERQAEEWLIQTLYEFGAQIRPSIKAPINENEYGAFVSLAYNIGPGAFRKSTALKRFNKGDKNGAAEALQWFNKAGGKKLKGLVSRRGEEAELFLTPVPRETFWQRLKWW